MSSSSGLHARKKTSNHDTEDHTDIETPKSPSGKGIDDKEHRQIGFLSRYVRSEIGCAIEVVVGFLLFGLFLGYMILHHQQRKVRRIELNSIDLIQIELNIIRAKSLSLKLLPRVY
jgi:hypothetical protein